jgi:hypothetical protein
LDGIDDRKSISLASGFGNAATKSIGLPSGDPTVAIESVIVPLDLIIDRTISIGLRSDSVELPKTSVSPGQNSVSRDQSRGISDQGYETDG